MKMFIINVFSIITSGIFTICLTILLVLSVISEIIYKKNTAIKKKKNKDLFVKNANVLIGTNKNKEITLSLLSSFNEDKIY